MTDENIIVLYKDMPTRIRSFVLPDNFGNYMVVLNSRLSHEQNLKSMQHEIEHIEKGDYENIHNVDVLEFYRHNIYKAN